MIKRLISPRATFSNFSAMILWCLPTMKFSYTWCTKGMKLSWDRSRASWERRASLSSRNSFRTSSGSSSKLDIFDILAVKTTQKVVSVQFCQLSDPVSVDV